MIIEEIPPNPDYEECLGCPVCDKQLAWKLGGNVLKGFGPNPHDNRGTWTVECACGLSMGDYVGRRHAVTNWNKRGGEFLNNDGLPRFVRELTPLCDRKRHLICLPYSIENLHEVAEQLGIDRCWFHKDHYDIPKRRIKEITEKCRLIGSRDIIVILKSAVCHFSFDM